MPHNPLPDLPLAERFHSLQGEGRWSGTPMHFIRLAGCSVGKLPGEASLLFPILKTGAQSWQCQTYDGRSFVCDTDFNKHEVVNADDLLDDTWEEHICFTGGEPLVHLEKLRPVFTECVRRGIRIHLETSGTIFLSDDSPIWVAVSPKLHVLPGMILRANEIKLLVDDQFDLANIPYDVKRHSLVYVQPINQEMSVDKRHLEMCMNVLRIRPDWHLSVQLHKFLGVR